MKTIPGLIIKRNRPSRASEARQACCVVIGLSAPELRQLLRLLCIGNRTLPSRHRAGPLPVLRSAGAEPRGFERDGTGGVLTKRERQILLLQQRGASHKDIARALQIEVQTVKNHLHHIRIKVAVSRRGANGVRPAPLAAPIG